MCLLCVRHADKDNFSEKYCLGARYETFDQHLVEVVHIQALGVVELCAVIQAPHLSHVLVHLLGAAWKLGSVGHGQKATDHKSGIGRVNVVLVQHNDVIRLVV